MKITNFHLQKFRNYEDEHIEFIPEINVLIGNNGQGKTNLIEGIYYLLTGKSYRVQRDHELVKWDQDEFHLYGNFDVNRRRVFLESHYQNRKRRVKINQVPCQRLSDFVGTINVIFFPRTIWL